MWLSESYCCCAWYAASLSRTAVPSYCELTFYEAAFESVKGLGGRIRQVTKTDGDGESRTHQRGDVRQGADFAD